MSARTKCTSDAADRAAELAGLRHYELVQVRDEFVSNLEGEELAATEALYKELEEVREPRALLTTMAKRVLFNIWRRRDLEQAYMDALAAMPVPTYPSPEDRLITSQALLAIDSALDGLPPKARQAFLYSQLDGLTYAEIGEKLGVSASMVRQYMVRATLAVVTATENPPAEK